jgi:hypothetical protein
MYRGFRVNKSKSDRQLYNALHREHGLALYNGYNTTVARRLMQYIRSDNYLDGTGIQKSWFPDFECNVFISHSHADKDLAITLAGWLYEKFNIVSFIDSAVWGNANDLLKEIDNLYCKNLDETTYVYKERNKSTSHVHMMLASAITSMIDSCECLFFLNTPNSLKLADGGTLTDSPWIYYEIGQSQIIRPNFPERPLYEGQRTFSDGGLIEKSLGVTYQIDLSHLSEIDVFELEEWSDQWEAYSGILHPLDLLYQRVPPKKIKKQLHG